MVGASCFVALCARVTVPLPFTPVPLTLQNFAVLLVGLALGSRRGFAALALYLAEGAFGLPVFNPTGLGGIAQLLGPTGGYLMAYPFVAFVSGWIAERGSKSFRRYAVAAAAGRSVAFRRRAGLAERVDPRIVVAGSAFWTVSVCVRGSGEGDGGGSTGNALVRRRYASFRF